MNKPTNLLALLLLLPFLSNAQFETGQKVLGGNISFATGKQDNFYSGNFKQQQTNLNTNISLGVFHSPTILTGFGISYGFANQKIDNTPSSPTSFNRNNNIGVDVFKQKFIPLTTKFFFTIMTDASVTYYFGKHNNQVSSTLADTKFSGYNVGIALAPGISYRLTQRLLFDASLNNLFSASFSHWNSKVQTTTTTNEERTSDGFSVSSSLSNTNLGNIGLGFRLLLKK